MDKEKLLKKFIAKFVVGQTLASAFIFLWIFAHEYGYIVEGDRGRLTFQGTRFLSFERI